MLRHSMHASWPKHHWLLFRFPYTKYSPDPYVREFSLSLKSRIACTSKFPGFMLRHSTHASWPKDHWLLFRFLDLIDILLSATALSPRIPNGGLIFLHFLQPYNFITY